MSEIIDYLESPAGMELTHAVIILITAVAAYVAYLARGRAKEADEKIAGHMFLHRQADYREAAESTEPKPKT